WNTDDNRDNHGYKYQGDGKERFFPISEIIDQTKTDKCEQSDFPIPYPPGYQCKKDRKSTRLNSSHVSISYAVFCLKKKKYKLKTHLTRTCDGAPRGYGTAPGRGGRGRQACRQRT